MTALVERFWGLAAAAAANGLRDRLVAGGAVAFVIYTLGYFLTFLTQLSVAHHLGANNYGVYAYVFAWVSVLAYVAVLGFNVSLLRFVPLYATIRAWTLLAGVLSYAGQRVVGSGIVLAALGAVLVAWLDRSLSTELRDTFLLGFPIVPLFALLMVRCAAIRALGGVAASLAPNRLIREGFVLTVVLCAQPLGALQVPPAMMLVTLIGTLVALVAATFAMRRRLPAEARTARREYAAQVWWPATLPLLVVTAVEALFDKTGTLVLGMAGAREDAGMYALAFNLALLVIVPRTAVETIFAPTIARLHAERNHVEVRRLMVKASLLSFGGAACVAGLLVVAAGPILAWFGQEFAAARLPLLILLGGQLFAAASGSQLLVLAMTGHERRAAHILVACAAANVVLCALLVARLGLAGAAISTTITMVGWNVLMAREIHRKLDLWPGLVALFLVHGSSTRSPEGIAGAASMTAAASHLSSLQPEESKNADRSD